MENLLRVLQVAASGLSTQRMRLNVVANNIANANTTRTEGEGAYRRRQVVVRPKEGSFLPGLFDLGSVRGGGMPESSLAGVEVARIIVDDRPGPRVYEPDHPDADEEGYVEYPNVDVVTEMTDMLSAMRSYQANVTVIDTIKQALLKALEIGRS